MATTLQCPPANNTKINVDEWLKQNKLNDHIKLFKSKNIAIEELTEFTDDDLEQFAIDTLKLDILSKSRFIKAIKKIKQKTKPSTIPYNRQQVIISQKEQQGLQNLYNRFDECSKLQMIIQNALNDNLNKSTQNTTNNINNTFNNIIIEIKNRKIKLLKDIDIINNNKQILLKKQLNILQNKYIEIIKNGKNKYKQYCDAQINDLNVIQMVNNILSFNDHNISTCVLMTQPKIEFNIDNALTLTQIFTGDIKIDDCDRALSPTITVTKVESDKISISYDIKRKYYRDIGKPILKICIEWALVKDDNDIWNDYMPDIDIDVKSNIHTDSDTNSDTDSDTDTDSNTDSDSNSSSDTGTDSGSDDESGTNSDSDDVSHGKDGNLTTNKKKKNKKKKKKKNTFFMKKKKKKRKKKKKKKQKIVAKKNEPKIRVIDVGSIVNYDNLTWLNETFKISSKKKKKIDKKYDIETKIKNNKTYVVRIKLLNESGWSDYTNKVDVIKTKKQDPDPKIRPIALYHPANFAVTNKKRFIQGNGSCSGFVLYASDNTKGKGYKHGVHYWSVKLINSNQCYRAIGILSGKREQGIVQHNSEFWPKNLKGFHYDGYARGWTNGEIVTVKLDCTKSKVTFFKERRKIEDKKIEKNTRYHFALCLCGAKSNKWECVKSKIL